MGVVIWDTAWNLLWTRKQNLYAEVWDMNDNSFEHMEVRPTYRYSLVESEINKDEEVMYYPKWKRVLIKWVSWLITAACIAIVVLLVTLFYHWAKPWLDDTIGKGGYRVSRSCFTGMCMSILNA